MTRYQLLRDVVPLLLNLPSPVTREAAVERVVTGYGIPRERVEQLFDALLHAGVIEEEQSSTEQSAAWSWSFARLIHHRLMLMDGKRNLAYQRAIASHVRPGSVVADVGCGSGIFSFFAARAGATKVYGLETTRMIDEARTLARDNGMIDQVELVEGDAAEFDRPVDLVMSDFVGNFLFNEFRLFDTFSAVRNRCLRPGGNVIPRRVHVYLCPVSDSALYMEKGLGFWERPVYGFDFRLGRTRQLETLVQVGVDAVNPLCLLAEPHEILDLDCATATIDAYFFQTRSQRTISFAAECHGYVGFLRLELAPGVVLESSPFSTTRSWGQTYFPTEAFTLQAGDVLTSQVTSTPGEVKGGPTLTLDISVTRGGTTVHAASYRYPIGDLEVDQLLGP